MSPGAEHLLVPGRIEVFGKHTDYAGGRSLTCATEQGVAVTYAPRADDVISIVDTADGSRAQFRLAADLEPAVGAWSNYPMTVARRLARNFPGVSIGAAVSFRSTLPRAAGLSSSSALIAATYLVLAQVNALAERADHQAALPTPEALAGYLGCIENGRAYGTLAGDSGVGTLGGSEDHTAILLSTADHLAWYHYFPVTPLGRVALDPALTFAIAASGVEAAKTGAARERYNRASALVTALVHRWREVTGRADATLAAALEGGPGAENELKRLAREGLPDFPAKDLENRLAHFLLEEGVLLPAAIDALSSGGLDDLGLVSDESQRAAEMLLGNQVPETIALARLAREHGAIAASAFGAGFGGSVWALTAADDAPRFIETWRAAYLTGHPPTAMDASFFTTRPGSGALALTE